MGLTLWRARAIAQGILGEPVIENGAILTEQGRIKWIGEHHTLAKNYHSQIEQVIDFPSSCLTPGLVDCHTHLVYGGQRAHEFALRMQGESYETIAKAGGGIKNTVKQTQNANFESLYTAAEKRLQAMCRGGVTTLEIKSGYGLDFVTEAKMLKVAQALAENYPVDIQKTYLGLHVLPESFQADRTGYLAQVVEEILPNLVSARLVDAVDAFCEKIAFTAEEIQVFFKAAAAFQLPVKLHAEQLSDAHGVDLGVAFHALSVDHLEYLSKRGLEKLASSKTVAVLLPVAYYYLRESQLPPVEALRAHGIPMAIATDCNPGSSPTTSLLLAMNMASVLFGLTPEEAFVGATHHAAKALGLAKQCGTLEVGKNADFAIWDVEHPVELVAGIGHNPCQIVVKQGKITHDIKDSE